MPKQPHTHPAFRRPSLGGAGSVGALAVLALSLGCTGEVTGTPPGNQVATGGSGAMAGMDSDGDGIVDTPIPPDTDPPLDNTPDGIAAACAAANGVLNTGVTRLRRMTRAQLNNT